MYKIVWHLLVIRNYFKNKKKLRQFLYKASMKFDVNIQMCIIKTIKLYIEQWKEYD